MKTVKKIFFLLLIAVFTGVSFNSYSSVEKENRKISGVKAIKVSAGIDLYLTMGDSEKLTIVADDDLIDDVITEVRNGVLKIYLKNKFFRWNLNWNKERKAYVTLKQIEQINASSGSDVVSENLISGDQLVVNTSSGSNVNLEVEVNSLDVDSSSGSNAQFSGKSKNLTAEASSGSNIKAYELKTKNSRVNVSSGGNVKVNVSGSLQAKASSGGGVKYTGNPDIIDTNESSGGNISRH